MSEKLQQRQLMVLSQEQQTITFAHGETPIITLERGYQLPAIAMAINALRADTNVVQLSIQNDVYTHNHPNNERHLAEVNARVHKIFEKLSTPNEVFQISRQENFDVGLVIFRVTRTVKK